MDHSQVMSNLRGRQRKVASGGVNCIRYKFASMQSDFPGYEFGNYVLISSFTKGGKTAYALDQLFDSMIYCYNNKKIASMKVLYFNLEETEERIVHKFMCWLLWRIDKIRLSPKELRSTSKPIDKDILDRFDTPRYRDVMRYFYETFTFSQTSNPYGICKECEDYAKAHGKVYYKDSTFSDNKIFDHYEQDNPNEYRFIVVDHVSLLSLDSGMKNLKEAIDTLSGMYLVKKLRNRYNFIPFIIQQQSTENESSEMFKQGRIRPSISGLGDSKYTGRDTNAGFGIFSPFKFGLKMYPPQNGYDITKFRDHIRFVEMMVNRDGEQGGMKAVFFDGANCTFEELPPPNDVQGLQVFYNRIDAMNNTGVILTFISDAKFFGYRLRNAYLNMKYRVKNALMFNKLTHN